MKSFQFTLLIFYIFSTFRTIFESHVGTVIEVHHTYLYYQFASLKITLETGHNPNLLFVYFLKELKMVRASLQCYFKRYKKDRVVNFHDSAVHVSVIVHLLPLVLVRDPGTVCQYICVSLIQAFGNLIRHLRCICLWLRNCTANWL